MGIDRSSNPQQRVDSRLSAESLQDTHLDANRLGQQPGQVLHRGNHAGYSYHAKPDRTPRPPFGRLPIGPRQQLRQRRARMQTDGELIGDRFGDFDDDYDDHEEGRGGGGRRDDLFNPFGQPVSQRPGPHGESGHDGSHGEDGGGSERPARMLLGAAASKPVETTAAATVLTRFKYTVGKARVSVDVGGRLIGMGVPGADRLFSTGAAPLPTGPGAVGDVMRALADVMLSTARTGTGLAANAPSLTRVALVASRAALDRLPVALTSSTTLSDVKQLLISRVNALWGGQPLPKTAPETTGDSVALLPLRTLNVARPRIASARQCALDLLTSTLGHGSV